MCGSQAEFYIRPLISCIDDIDYLVTRADYLVFSGEFSVLPSDFSDLAETIICFVSEPYHRYPGFVRLRKFGDMNYNWKLKKYVFNYIDYTANIISHATVDLDQIAETYSHQDTEIFEGCIPLNIVRGPAINRRIEGIYKFATDEVRCMWCHQWPKEAQSWLSRPRYNGWPTTDVISEVVQSGCHLVYTQHRSCRNDKLQWRFSFSIAELILLQSWTQTQQIIYHLLRFLAKRELIQKDCPKEDEVLCTYHLKTLMLWACEQKSPEWWNSSSVISICSELLKMLSKLFKRNYCPNYFIPEANLFHKHPILKIVEKFEKRLDEFCNSGVLCNWFVENYILSFIRKHVEPTSKWTTMTHYIYYMPHILETWEVSDLRSLDHYFKMTLMGCYGNSRPAIKQGLNSGLRNSFAAEHKSIGLKMDGNWKMRYLPTTQFLGMAYYGIMLHMLETVHGLDCEDFSWNSQLFLAFVAFVKENSMQSKIVRSQYHNFPNTFTAKSSHFQFLRAQSLMENLTGSNSHSEFYVLSFTAKQLFRKALKHQDSISNGIAHAALAYLASIHYATSEYQEATRLCSAIQLNQTSKDNREMLNAGCLFFIDDVARIVGLCALHKRITEDNLHHTNRRLYLDLRISPEVFAQYLLVLSAERTSRWFYHDLSDSSFSMDVYTKSLMKLKFSVSIVSDSHCNAARQIVYSRPNSLTDTEVSSVNPSIDKERVIDALMEYALENLASFYNFIRKDYGYDCNIGDCYRALYLCNCRQYDQVLYLCEQSLKDSDIPNDLKKYLFAKVLLLPPFDCFFERDVRSLLGFHTLFYGLSPLNDHLGKVKLSDESTLNRWFAREVRTYKHELMYSIISSYSIKCQYFLGRHFLAKYLKLRCCIDCNLPYSEALTEFVAHKTNFPFEHIIRRFFLRKLRILRNN